MNDRPHPDGPILPTEDNDSWPVMQGETEYDDPGQLPSTLPDTRLCPHCDAVTVFRDGYCERCGRAPVATGEPPPFELAPAAPLPVMKFLPILLGLVLLAVLAVFVLPLFRDGRSTDTLAPAPVESVPEGEVAAKETGFTGTLDPVSLDEELHTDVGAAFKQANAALKTAGRKAYVYRYSAYEKTVPATSQLVLLTAYVGGPDAGTVAAAPGDAVVRAALASLLEQLNTRPGVEASLELRSTDGAESPAADDRYIVHGDYFGREHMMELKPIIDDIEAYRSEFGQFPISLTDNVVRGIKTKGGITFNAGGVGYIPMFQADGAGNIKMGSGSGLDRYTPEKVTGYYLLRFLDTPTEGIDMYSAADEAYYVKNISPFPYQPQSPVHNMQFHPDGKPDGIATVIQNGKVLSLDTL